MENGPKPKRRQKHKIFSNTMSIGFSSSCLQLKDPFLASLFLSSQSRNSLFKRPFGSLRNINNFNMLDTDLLYFHIFFLSRRTSIDT